MTVDLVALAVDATDPQHLARFWSRLLDRDLAEAWVRALVPSSMAGAVHEVYSPTGTTFVWLVDGTFTPVYSPPPCLKDWLLPRPRPRSRRPR